MRTPAHDVVGRSVLTRDQNIGGLLVSPLAETTIAETTMTKEAKILHVNNAGLCVVEVNDSHQQLPFTFDKIAGYRGELASEIGLVRGRRVFVVMGRDGIIRVEIPTER